MFKIIILISIMFSVQAFAYSEKKPEECLFYKDGPRYIKKAIGDVNGFSLDKLKKVIERAATKFVSSKAKSVGTDVEYTRFSGKYLVFTVKAMDDIWSSLGGSTYQVLVSSVDGKVKVNFISCWDNNL